MFESDAAARSLLDRIRTSVRAENRAAAEGLVSIDNLYRLRLRENGELADWALDTLEQVAAEIAAALRISQGLAANRLGDAIAMRKRLPEVGKAFLAGEIDYLMFQTIVTRTDLITDEDRLAAADAELSGAVAKWPSLDRHQLLKRIDRIVERHDRDAVRRRKKKRADRWIEISDCGDYIIEIRGLLRVLDGRAFNARLDALAATVCPHDPRTVAQRRADAVGAMAAGADRLACECDRPDCTAGDKPASAVVLHVVANQGTVEGTSDEPGCTIDPDELFPADLITELAKSAKLVPVVHPGDAQAECGYAPSRKLADFVRARDLTCRYPGCNAPAIHCELDHTIPHRDGGPTHASNLKCLCVKHHQLKTFGNWRDRQLPDGTVEWTSPSGEKSITTPGSSWWFPSLCAPTGTLSTPASALVRSPARAAMMPKRRRTRAQNRAMRIAAERRLNRQDREVELGQQRWERALAMASIKNEPPPF
ncbi:hypothetical protein CQY20_20080 [Mycolicibacterium agri]|uniref:HNH nuclease domain-containing protein n=1 Tax=Mycolicibacterium agri TaxID=36811 RepID=A0A2A7MWC7_MYCAG|nr:HNH endonuclease signature motif containing protein [Mycolicibacterium agri]PEG36035.1 hypothetical protein CQY20_20080 [Mycolicibacterium agri]GFG54331.1 hypothetical protein MAGR_57720 [Mycolicibacterium agri]